MQPFLLVQRARRLRCEGGEDFTRSRFRITIGTRFYGQSVQHTRQVNSLGLFRANVQGGGYEHRHTGSL